MIAPPVLYDYWRSSASYRVRIALNLAGIPYETIPVDLLAADHKNADYLKLNPQGLVPTLVVDGAPLSQSLAIVEYLNELRPEAGLLPDDAIGRHRVRALSYAVAMEIHPICNTHVAAHVVELLGEEKAREEWVQRFILDGLAKLEAMLSGNSSGYCVGNRPTMADLCLVPQVYNARRWGVDMSRFSRIVNIDARCAEQPAFSDAHPDRAKSRNRLIV